MPHAVAAETTALVEDRITGCTWCFGRRTAAVVVACLALIAVYGSLWLRAATETAAPSVAAIDVYGQFIDSTPVAITVYAGGEYVPWSTTVHAIRTDGALWRRMHLVNWNSVPAPFRAQGLDALLERYRPVLTNPRIWDVMTIPDWDLVPQPVRTVAFRQMVAYWTGFYGLGNRFDLPPALVSDTLAAIVMSESWFEHRATHHDRSGNADIGLAQASGFARTRIQELYRAGIVDISLTTEDYLNPWSATRFAAVWFDLLLQEADGDLDLAVRAYNRGLANAFDDRGTAYLAAVKRRLHRFIRNQDAPAAWAHVWYRARQIEHEEWPWMSPEG
jgi:hypothetical protein